MSNPFQDTQERKRLRELLALERTGLINWAEAQELQELRRQRVIKEAHRGR